MSSHRNLASKYRPRRIDAVVGQDEIKPQIRQLLKRKELPTALLFAGPSGCGKTTTARIFASTINCATKDACGKCESCRMAMSDPPQHPDIHEHDSTTARGIDEVRAFLNQARFAPQFNARVFILDECFPGDTEVEIRPGIFAPLEDIINDPESYGSVLSYDIEHQTLQLQPVISRTPKEAAVGTMVRVHLSDGSYQDCTEEHKWWSVDRGCMVKATDLVGGETLLTPDGLQNTAE